MTTLTTIVFVYTENTINNYNLSKSFFEKIKIIDVIGKLATADKNVAMCRNEALRECKTDTIVFMPLNYLFHNALDIAVSLFSYNSHFEPLAGCIGVLNQYDTPFHSYLKNLSDEMFEVNYNDSKNLYFMYMAQTKRVLELGGFEEDNLLAPHIDQLLERKMQVKGFVNFFLPFNYAYTYKLSNNELMPRATKESVTAFNNLSNEYAKGSPMETEDINDIM